VSPIHTTHDDSNLSANDSHEDTTFDTFDEYERTFDPLTTDRRARRQRKPKVKHTPKRPAEEVIHSIAETEGLESGFNTTYTPGLFEEGWLLEALRPFYEQALISDVLARVKGGKEANVYRCQGHPSTGVDLLAVKVYRPRMFRNLRNDKMYREGRALLNDNGHAIKANEHRLMRAIGKKTAFGEQVAHTSWLMYEYITLETLYKAGAAVPKPYRVAENAILMGYCGDAFSAAPALSETTLDYEEALALFDVVLENVTIMLKHGLIHGDLSAYNILYWSGAITLIDFPQVTYAQSNPNAKFILERDVQRVCDYFAACGVERDAAAITGQLWQNYGEKPYRDQLADLSRLEEE